MSLINEALRRADADKGPPPRRATPPPPAPAQAPPRAAATQAQRWSALHVALLGAALVLAVSAGLCLWNMMGGSPAQVAGVPASRPAAASPETDASASRPAAPPAVSALAQAAAAAAEAKKRGRPGDPPRPGPAPASPKPPAPDSPAPQSKDLLAAPPTPIIDAADPQPAAREPGSEKVSGTLSRRVPDTFSEPVPAAPGSRAPAVGAAAAALAPEEPKSEAQPSTPPAEPKPEAQPSAPPPAPAAPAEDELAKFKVSSVVVSGKVATAIINGRVVGVGDTVDGAKILAITRHSIDLEINGHQATLRM
jgi:hypothetical protein